LNTLDVQYPQILDECITHFQDGSMTYEACLIKYPQYAEQLQHDLAIFQLTQHISAPPLEAQAVDALETKLLKQFNPTAPQSKRPQPIRIAPIPNPYLRWVAGFVIAFIILMGAGGGTVYSSSSSLPGETLYPVKIAWEQVIVLVSTFLDIQDEVWLQLTQTRANEILSLHEQGQLTDEVLDTFYNTAETAVLYATDDTEQDYIELVDELRPVFSEAILLSTTELRRFRILRILSPELNVSGQLELPVDADLLPQSEDNPTATPTMTQTSTPTLTATPTQTETPTITSTPTSTTEPTQTRTPTPSRTPTLAPSITPTLTFTPQPTATWTPLGVQPRGDRPTTASNTGEQVTSNQQSTKPASSGNSNLFVRETERSVELTQTAIALTPTDDTP
jgi:hypothetical protein